MPPADPAHYVRGQYQGYVDVPGVARDSATETFVALRLEIDNWRWADVPIFLRAVHLDTSFVRELGEPPEPYERLLYAALAGDHQLFARENSVEETWRIVQPLLDRPPDVRPYPRGSWGPDDAETLVHRHPRWQQPWLPADR
jgi:glucose-6-phosphate 1-dehydrogenase